jgi:hypothetical protein
MSPFAKFTAIVLGAVVLGLASFSAFSQSVPGSLKIDWVQPTVSVDGLPLTGSNSLTGIEVYISTAPIPDNFTGAATVIVSGAATTTTQTVQVANGSTVYVRLRAINTAGKSALTNQISKLVQVSAVPGVPTSVTITLTIG